MHPEKTQKSNKEKKILLIDKEKFFHDIFNTILKDKEKNDLILISAFDGKSGIELAEEYFPDIIITDLVLPQKNGFEVLREIKKNPRLINIPIIVLTNLIDTHEIEQAMSYKISSYLIKSDFTPTEVLEKIEKLLSK